MSRLSPIINVTRCLIVVAIVGMTSAQPVPPPAGGGTPKPPAQGGGTGTQPQTPIHSILQSIPEAATATVPDWIAPGTRLAYWAGMGTVNDAAGAVKMVEDPNGPFTDANGKRFRQGDQVGTPTGNSWYHLIDVVAVEPGLVLLVNTGYHLGHGGVGTQSPLSSTTSFSHPSGCDYFLHPALMAKVPQPTSNGMDVMRYTMNHDNGTQYQCVHFVVANTGDHRQSVAYDVASGVQLSYTSIVKSTGETAFKPVGGDLTPTNNSSRSLSIMRFIAARSVELPWRSQSIPQWAKDMRKARYEGAISYAGPAYVNLPDWRVLTTAEFTTTKVGRTFITYDMEVTQQAPGQPAQTAPKRMTATGPASIGGLWMHPDALGQLQQGQVFDSDPTTGVQVGVEYVGLDNAGQRVVVIGTNNQVFKASYVYGAGDGRLLALTRQDYEQLTGNTQTLQMRLVGME